TSTDCTDGVFDASMTTSLKNVLTGTAVDWGTPGPDSEYGYGRLDGYAAVALAGGRLGMTGPLLPDHSTQSGSLAAPGQFDDYKLNVTSTEAPIAATLIMQTWTDNPQTVNL